MLAVLPMHVLRHLDVTFIGPTPLSQVLYQPSLLLGSGSVSSVFSRVFCPQTNAVGLNFGGSQTIHFESSSTPQITTSFYGAFDSIYITIHNENYLLIAQSY